MGRMKDWWHGTPSVPDEPDLHLVEAARQQWDKQPARDTSAQNGHAENGDLEDRTPATQNPGLLENVFGAAEERSAPESSLDPAVTRGPRRQR